MLSTIQITIAQIEQLLNSPIQFIDMMKLINSIRNLQIEAIQIQFDEDIWYLVGRSNYLLRQAAEIVQTVQTNPAGAYQYLVNYTQLSTH